MIIVGAVHEGMLVAPCSESEHYASVDKDTGRLLSHPTAPTLRDVCAGTGRIAKRDQPPPAHLIKVSREKDLYVAWGVYANEPVGLANRQDAVDQWGGQDHWVQDADKFGTTSAFCPWGREVLTVGNLGILRRDRLEDFSQAWLAGRKAEAEELLFPFPKDGDGA